VTINGIRTPLTRTGDGRLLAPIAFGMEAGPQTIQLIPASGLPVPPVLFQIDSQPPAILTVAGPQTLAISAQQRVRGGDRITLVVGNLGAGVTPAKEDIEIRVAGVAQRLELLEEQLAAGTFKIEFLVPLDAPAGDTQNVTVGVGTRVSAPVTIAIVAPDLPKTATEVIE
jgi:hypothetical protein